MTIVIFRDVLGEEVAPARFLPGNRRRRLSSIVARHADRSRLHLVSRHRVPETQLALSDESVVLLRERRHVLCGPKDYVVITYVPMGGGAGRGGGGSGKQIGMAVASIALMIAAPYAISFLGPAFAATAGVTSSLTLLGKVVSTGLVIGGVALMGLANKAKANKSNEDTRPVYGVSGGGNLPRPGDRIPVGYGRFWTLPDLSQPDYFIYSGEDQILYKRMTLGAGRYQIHSVRVGDQLLWTEGGGYHAPFTGAEVEFIQPGAVSNLVPMDVTSSASVTGLALPHVGDVTTWSGPFVVSPPGVNVNYIQFDLSLPSGSYGTAQNSKGTYDVATETGYELQIAPIDFAGNVIGAWQTVVAAERFVMSKRPLRYTERVNVALGRYAARGRNTKARFNSSSDTRMNAVQWDGLRGWRPDVRTRPGITEVALKVQSNESLGITSFQDVMIEATRILPVWNGVAWVEQATRKSVWAFSDVMRNGVYGANILDSALDLATLGYYATAAAPFDTFDGVIRGPDSIWGVASTILATMRAEPVQLGRVWSMVRDEPKSIRSHVITRRQIVQGSTAIEFETDPDDGTGHVIVDYDEGADPKRPVQPPDFVYGQASLTPQRRKLFGVSSYAHAVHLGRWIAAAGFYRRQTYKFATEHEGRIYKRGDSISVDAWFASKAKVAGIVARAGTTLTIDADIAFAAGDQIILRDRTGRQWGPVGLAGQGANLRELVIAATTAGGIPIADALATDEMEPTTVVVGQPTVLTRNYLVNSARPSGRDRISIEAQIDAPEVWAAIGEPIGSPPAPEAGPQTPVVPQIFYVSGEMAQGVAEPQVKWALSPARGATAYQVQVSYDDGGSWVEIYRGPETAGVAPLSAALFDDDEGVPIVLIRARTRGRTGLWSVFVNNSFGAFASQLSAGRLIDGTLDAVKFAQGIEPVRLAAGLPNPAGYSGPKTVFNTLDGKLYRFVGGQWISTVDAEDISGTLANAQIESLAASKITGQLTDAQIQAVAAAKISGQIVEGQITNGAVSIAKFAAGTRPVEIFSALPSSGNTVGRTVMLTTDNKLYRWTGSAWTAAVPATDVTGQLTDAQIAALAAAKVTGQLTNAQIADLAAAKITGQVVAAQIADAAITLAKFASGLRPVEIVATLPSTGNVVGRTVVLTTDQKLYRWNGTAWTTAVAAADISGTIAAVQIAALEASKITGQLSDSQLAAIAAAKITGQVVTTQISDNAITTAKVAASAITAGEIAAGSVVAAKIGASAVTAAKISAGAVDAAKIAAGAVETDKLAAAAVTTAKLDALAVTADKIAANAITAGKVAAGAISASEIAAGAVVASKLGVGDFTNLVPDSGLTDPAGWAATGWTIVSPTTTAASVESIGHLVKDSSVAGAAAYCFGKPFLVAPGREYFISYQAGRLSSGEWRVWGEVEWLDKADAVISRSTVASPLVTVGGVFKYSGTGLAPPLAVRARWRWAASIAETTALQVGFWAPTVRLRSGGELIVDGAITADKIGASAVTAVKISAGAIETAKIAAGAVTANEIASNSVTAVKIAAGAVETAKIAVGAVDAERITAGAVTTAKLDALAVTSDKLAASSVVAGKIAAGAVSATEIAAGAIIASKIGVGDFTNLVPDSELSDPAIWSGAGWALVNPTTATSPVESKGQITRTVGVGNVYLIGRNFAVVSGKEYYVSYQAARLTAGNWRVWADIQWLDKNGGLISTSTLDSGVTSVDGVQKFQASYVAPALAVAARWRWACVDSQTTAASVAYWAPTLRMKSAGSLIVDGAIAAAHIAVDAITTEKIAAGAVTADEIAANAITAAKISAGAVETAKIATGAVVAGSIAANAVVAGKIAANAVVAGNIAANAVVAGTVAAGAISTSQIVAGSVVTSSIAIGNITEDLLAQFSATRRTSIFWYAISGTGVSLPLQFNATAGSTILMMCRAASSGSGSTAQARINAKPYRALSVTANADDFTQVFTAHADYSGLYTAEVVVSATLFEAIDIFLSIVVIQR
jgi:hypothetical protein